MYTLVFSASNSISHNLSFPTKKLSILYESIRMKAEKKHLQSAAVIRDALRFGGDDDNVTSFFSHSYFPLPFLFSFFAFRNYLV